MNEFNKRIVYLIYGVSQQLIFYIKLDDIRAFRPLITGYQSTRFLSNLYLFTPYFCD